MIGWEYLQYRGWVSMCDRELAEFGEAGWEMVGLACTRFSQGDMYMLYVFKRPLESAQ